MCRLPYTPAVTDVCQSYFNTTAGKEEMSTSLHFYLKQTPWACPTACPEGVTNRNQGRDVFLCSREVLTRAWKGQAGLAVAFFLESVSQNKAFT